MLAPPLHPNVPCSAFLYLIASASLRPFFTSSLRPFFADSDSLIAGPPANIYTGTDFISNNVQQLEWCTTYGNGFKSVEAIECHHSDSATSVLLTMNHVSKPAWKVSSIQTLTAFKVFSNTYIDMMFPEDLRLIGLYTLSEVTAS